MTRDGCRAAERLGCEHPESHSVRPGDLADRADRPECHSGEHLGMLGARQIDPQRAAGAFAAKGEKNNAVLGWEPEQRREKRQQIGGAGGFHDDGHAPSVVRTQSPTSPLSQVCGESVGGDNFSSPRASASRHPLPSSPARQTTRRQTQQTTRPPRRRSRRAGRWSRR